MWGYLLILFVLSAGIFDLRSRKVPNWLILTGFILALISLALGRDNQPLGLTWGSAFAAFFSIFIIFLIFYVLGFMGGGDVKFAAVLGLWIGWKLMLPVWILSCGFAIVHGLFARSQLKYFFVNWMRLDEKAEVKGGRFIPYVTYLSLATIIVLIVNK